MKKKYGRPQLKKENRRSIARKISFSPVENEIVIAKSTEAGTTPTEWIRAASLKIQPKIKRVIPKSNQQCLLELSKITEILNEKMWHFAPGEESKIFEEMAEIKGKVGELQKRLLGENI